MPTRETPPIGAPCWVDISSTDIDATRRFYTGLFGWTAEEPNAEFGGYFNFLRDGEVIAGGWTYQEEQGGVPNVWATYLATDDAQKTCDAAAAEGGQVIAPPMVVGEFGTMAFMIDPTGAAIGVWEPNTHQGFATIMETGAPSWHELHTRDFDTAVSFYRNVFRWETQEMGDTDEFRYTVLVNGEQMLAGIMDATKFLPEGVPAYWGVYFGTADCDASVAKVVELGGSVVRPAEDTPYGRIAVVRDSTGTTFSLQAPNDQMPAK